MKSKNNRGIRQLIFILTATVFFFSNCIKADVTDPALPHIVQKDGRYALFVDGAPYLILGAQVNNSSGWPSELPKVWPAMEFLHVNTVEIPVYWEQFEPEYGHFDYSVIDTLLDQARDENMHLVLLWFGTWKNGSNHYMPRWMKLDPARYPNLISADGKPVDSPSPVADETLKADIGAFTAFMRHLKEADPQHTVLMVQVENEAGTWGAARDHSPAAQKLFESPVPDEILKAMNASGKKGTWRNVFGDDADEFFHVWCVSKFIGQVAAAGKAVYPLPLYVNASVRDPFHPGHPPQYECGGPNDNVFPIWKTEAPAVDILSPDIYQRKTANYLKELDFYHRADNPLFVPESIGVGTYSRFLFAALGRGAIGFSPFGMDYTRAIDFSPAETLTAEQRLTPTALNYELIGPMMRQIAQLNFDGKLQTAVDENDPPDPRDIPAPSTQPTNESDDPRTQPPENILHFPNWDVDVFFKPMRMFTPIARSDTPFQPNGRILVAQLGDNQFLVTGLYSRITFRPTGDAEKRPWQYLSVEEGKYQNGLFNTDRILNGDQTDWGLTFSSEPTVLRVNLYLR